MTTKSAIYVLDAPGKIANMFVSESGFSVNQDVDTYTFLSNDVTVPVHMFNVSDQCTTTQVVLSECLSKTAILDVTQPFGGNVLYLLIPEISLTKYSVAPNTEITMNPEGQIMVQISPGSEPEITDLSTTSATEIHVEPESVEHEIVVAFNLAKGIADSITQSNSSNSTSTNTTASMTPSTLSSVTP